jgi:hypothetical protein
LMHRIYRGDYWFFHKLFFLILGNMACDKHSTGILGLVKFYRESQTTFRHSAFSFVNCSI